MVEPVMNENARVKHFLLERLFTGSYSDVPNPKLVTFSLMLLAIRTRADYQFASSLFDKMDDELVVCGSERTGKRQLVVCWRARRAAWVLS